MHIEWLRAAKDDLVLIEKIIDEPKLTHLTAFHSQQAVEKSLKALLEYKQYEVPKIHSITRLFGLTKEYFTFESYDLINLLDSLYIESRYPGDLGLLPYGKPIIEDAKSFYNFASSVFDKVCEILEVNKEDLKSES